jgi:hypothetical protein
MKWNHFVGAALVAWMLLCTFGAPVISELAGTGSMALWNHLRRNG